ncbi:spore germination protein [Bacillus sp. ISL-35]|uniref:spore germination protein n=1 Tax=Bacillus sp. ISL-35 TaxID=2819122 RepID=UPI001BE65CF5|nr:spore germination protein [Bacillus sp. ISL-35]MBT2679112.1 spore germination protein [Bacillus sp. ISL-35]MBT2702805.1 spore germination protein [Chryseobacterium sp. ISL-80]
MLKEMLRLFKKQQKQPTPSADKLTGEQAGLKNQKFSADLENNLSVIRKLYSIPDNKDVKLREMYLEGFRKNAALIFISTISDVKSIEENILKPLAENTSANKQVKDVVSIQMVHEIDVFKDAVKDVNKGNALLLLDGEARGYVLDCPDFQGRAIEKPDSEILIKGPKESFNEKAVVNISLLRKKIKNENLIVEVVEVSQRSHNDVYVLYIRGLANEKLIDNIKKRLGSLEVNAIQNLSLLEEYIEERNYSLFPSLLSTERPDRAASFLEDGYIVLLMDNSPDGLVLPATFWSFFHTPEDHYLRFLYGNFTRALRMTALFITIFTSAIYISITTFHAEMIPPDLLLAIAASREKVPFPAVIEILIMEMAFELIREAGLRVPSPIGPTIGIVGALILGQAAVEANIISPIVIIVVALGGLSSFAVSDISLNFAVRLVRFLFILSAAVMGIYGMTAMFVGGLFYMVSIKSFGVPYLAPMSPNYKSSNDTIFRRLIKNEILRPGFLKSSDLQKKANGE